MITIFFLFIAVIVLDLATARWDANSSDGVDSPEWERRQRWYGFH